MSLWLVYVSGVVFSLLIGGSVPIFFAFSVIVFRIWLACETALGLLAQRLFTSDETWFEIVVDVRVEAAEGGLVAPGSII